MTVNITSFSLKSGFGLLAGKHQLGVTKKWCVWIYALHLVFLIIACTGFDLNIFLKNQKYIVMRNLSLRRSSCHAQRHLRSAHTLVTDQIKTCHFISELSVSPGISISLNFVSVVVLRDLNAEITVTTYLLQSVRLDGVAYIHVKLTSFTAGTSPVATLGLN